MREFGLSRDGVRLGGIDFGGTGQAVVLLHGLAGHAGEWRNTARDLTRRPRVVALDARGHGASETRPRDVSLGAQAEDVALAIEHLELGASVVVGQSFGGQTAILLAATRPDLVRGLVIAEADPDAGDERVAIEVENWLRSWPVPFASPEEATAFFGGSAGRAAAWTEGLEKAPDGWRPRFEIDSLIRMLHEAHKRSYWGEWGQIACPTLIVRADNGDLSPTMAALVGALDDFLPHSDNSSSMQATAPGSRAARTSPRYSIGMSWTCGPFCAGWSSSRPR